MTKRAWRDRAELAGVIVFILDVLVYVGRCFMHRSFHEGHSSIKVVCAESGFIASIVTLVLAVVSLRNRWNAVIAVGSLVMAYLWFSDVAWWVIVK
jgi:hypothetical protein